MILYRHILSMSIMIYFLLGPIICLDYQPYHTPNCEALDKLIQTNNLEALWNIFILHGIDMYTFMCICPIIFIAQLLILLTYWKNSSLLIRSGKIFKTLILIETVLNLSLFTNAIYHAIFSDHKLMPDSFPAFCTSMSLIFVCCEIAHFSYLLIFLIVTIINFRFSLRKRPKKSMWFLLNTLIMSLSLGLTLLLYFTNLTGLSYYGICQITLAQQPQWNRIMPWISITISILYTIFGIFTLVYFRKHIPKLSIFQKRKNSQNRIVSMIVIGFSCFLLLESMFQLLLDLNCLTFSNPSLDVLTTISNLSRLCQYIFLIIIIFRYSIFRSKFKTTLRKILSSNERQPFLEKQGEYIINSLQMEEIAFDERLLRIKQRSNEIDLLLTLQIYTIITGIYISHFEYHHRGFLTNTTLKQIYYKQKVSFTLDNNSAINYETEARSLVQLKILNCSVMLHAPRVFQKILQQDGLKNVYDSFKVVENLKKIWNSVQGRGGKSGQFFYFTADNKYVLKTITIEEFDFLINNLESFVDYYKSNPDTLLAKIYGIFTIKGNQIQRTFRLILMKNILGCSKSQVQRIYDMKGSKHDRQVIKDINDLEQASKMTLKDTDFLNYEVKLNVDQDSSKKLRQCLQKDTTFLKNLNLIDYSLLVVRVRWQVSPRNASFWSDIQRVKHLENPYQYYHIGLIDYMQKWDLQKKSEKWWKNMLGKRNVSAAAPDVYQKRFQNFVQDITSLLPPIQMEVLHSKAYKTKQQQQQNNKYEIKISSPKQEEIQDYVQQQENTPQKPNKITRDSSSLRIRENK